MTGENLRVPANLRSNTLSYWDWRSSVWFKRCNPIPDGEDCFWEDCLALIQCVECGRSISSFANACPGCGCPISVSLAGAQLQAPVGVSADKSPMQIDCTLFGKEELWSKAYYIQYKCGKSDLPAAIEVYRFIISKFEDSAEAGYAKQQLLIQALLQHVI